MVIEYVSSSEEDLDDESSEYEDIDEIYLISSEFGKTETWFRYGLCIKWAYK